MSDVLCKRAKMDASNGTKAMISSQMASDLEDTANRVRLSSIEMTNASRSGHPTSASSCAEMLACLYFHAMRYDAADGRDAHSDRFVMSKGHACPALYAIYEQLGVLSKEQTLSLRKIDSDVEGHPTPRLGFIDVATGSLGQGLSCAAGMAYVGKHMDGASYKVYCMLGDGESAEGSVWEAVNFASHYKLDNLVALFDINRLGQSQPTMLQHDVHTYKRRLDAFGWSAHVVDGHNVTELCTVLDTARHNTDGRPTAVVAKTFKGHNIPGVADQDNWHGKPVGERGLSEIAAMIKNKDGARLAVHAPTKDAPDVSLPVGSIRMSAPPNYKLGDKVATRLAYGTALAKLGEANSRVIALDGDTKNSTFADKLLKVRAGQFIECFIAEQNMVGVAVGCAARQRTIPFVSTFAAFFTRAADQLRMAAVSAANIKCAGSHVGVSIGEDGPSQMGLEDLALFRSLPTATVFYPSDAVSAERAVELAANTPGICYIRTSRPAMKTIYGNEEAFAVGKAKVVRESAADRVLIIGAGVTLLESLDAADALAGDKTAACVIDPFTIAPLDSDTILRHATRCGATVVVEDHYPAGGMGEAIGSMLLEHGYKGKFKSLAVTQLPRSGKPDELLHMFGISAQCIKQAVANILQ